MKKRPERNRPEAVEPSIADREAFRVLGVEDTCEYLEENDPSFGKIWLERFMAHHDTARSQSTDGKYYQVFFFSSQAKGHPQWCLCGMAVEDATELPDGWVVRDVPKARYVVFETTLKYIGETVDYAFSEWLPASKHRHDHPKPHFILFPPDVSGPDSTASVWIPVRKR